MVQKRKLKEIVYLGILAITILIFHNPLIVKAATREEALNWVYAQEGKSLDYDGQYGAQCVDLIKYYYDYFGKASYAKGNGCNYVSNALPDGWIRIKNTADFIPEPGDIAVWGTELSKNGHVAIIISAGANSFVSMDQNWPSGSACKRVTHNYNKFWGIIRPNYTSPSGNTYYNSYGFDNPSSDEIITEGTFLFQGWIDAKKEISSITCSINHGAHYTETALYKRPDVPNATAFRVEVDSNLLNLGKNDVALCVNFKDGSATVVENRTVTWTPKLQWGFDSPSEGMQISDNQFQFFGWIESGRKLERITCSLNNGERYLTAALYKRPDVPNATAFRLDIDSSYLHYGENYVAVCAYYADGEEQTIAEHKVNKCTADAMEYPQNEEKFNCKNEWFLLQGWSVDNNKGIDHFEFTVNGVRYNTAAHSRADLLANARYYREEVPLTKLQNGKNKIEIFALYTDGTSRNIGQVEVSAEVDHKWDSGKITQAATCAKTGIKTYTCAECKNTKTEEIPATGEHINTEVRNAKIATCTAEGYTGDTYCKDCGILISTGQKISKKEHFWYKTVIIKQPTCVEPGIKEHICAECLGREREEIPPTGIHTNTEIRNEKSATCTEEGYTGDTYCKDCGTQISTGQIIEKTAHTWDEGKVTQEATCIENGIKTYTCTVCQTTKTEEISSTSHQNGELRNAKGATCSQEGYTGDIYCTECGMKLTSGISIPKLAHTWNDGTVTKKATCTETGIKTYTCVICQETKTEIIPVTGKHENTEVRNVKDPTCSQEGYTGDAYCKDCGTLLSAGKSIPKTDHTWDDGKVTQKATCTTKGITTFTCKVCEATRTEELPVTGHTNKITKFAKSVSCKSEGYTGDIYCQDCGILLEEGKIIPKTEHTWNAGKVTKTAACTAEGIRTFTCTSCGITRIEAISATGHGNTETRNEKDASCSSEGYTGDLYCTVCGQKMSSGSVIAKTSHSWDSGVVTKQPTVAEEGIKTYTCRNCGATKTETLEKQEQQTATPGKTVKDKATNGIYQVVNDGLSVEYTKPISKKASIKIPNTITVNGIICKVTGISANAFKNNASLKSITIGNNVTVIGSNAFYGCKKLNKVSGGAGIVKIGDKAFANCRSLSSITIPAAVRSIGKQTFYNCKNLRTIIVKTSALSSKNIGSKAFAGTYQRPTIKVPAKQMKAYKKLLRSKGMSAKAVYKK